MFHIEKNGSLTSYVAAVPWRNKAISCQSRWLLFSATRQTLWLDKILTIKTLNHSDNHSTRMPQFHRIQFNSVCSASLVGLSCWFTFSCHIERYKERTQILFQLPNVLTCSLSFTHLCQNIRHFKYSSLLSHSFQANYLKSDLEVSDVLLKVKIWRSTSLSLKNAVIMREQLLSMNKDRSIKTCQTIQIETS